MNKKDCPVHRYYLAGQEERLAEPFPLLKSPGFTMRTIGGGDGNSSLLNTQEQLLVEHDEVGIWMRNCDPFNEELDKILEMLSPMDDVALGQLLKDRKQKFLNALFDLSGITRVEVRYDFAESENVIQTFGADRSLGTGRWFSCNYIYRRGQEPEHKPVILLLLPSNPE